MHISKLNDARIAPREGIRGLVSVEIEGLPHLVQAELDNVSLSGCLIWTDSPISLDRQLVIRIAADNPGTEEICLVGKVVRVTRRDGTQRSFGSGCMIEPVDNT